MYKEFQNEPALGAIAPIDFEKSLFAPINFRDSLIVSIDLINFYLILDSNRVAPIDWNFLGGPWPIYQNWNGTKPHWSNTSPITSIMLRKFPKNLGKFSQDYVGRWLCDLSIKIVNNPKIVAITFRLLETAS